MNRIPQELLDRKQWVSFTVENLDGRVIKTPFIPGTSRLASSTDPSHWRTFDEAAEHGHPAFALSADDPFVFIDFDELKLREGEDVVSLDRRKEAAADVWKELENTFITYTERSVSGHGVHAIGKGRLKGPGTQRKDYGLELYDRGRFVIFTGDVIFDAPVADFPADKLLELEQWMRKETPASASTFTDDPETLERPERLTDEQVIDKISQLSRVPALFRGEWKKVGDYPSQSEADYDLIAQIFKTCRNTPQTERIFHTSVLHISRKTPKVHDYVARITHRIKLEMQTLEREMDRIKKSLAVPSLDGHHKVKDKAVTASDDSFRKLVDDLPVGLVKDITNAFLKFAYYPLCEGSLVGALNLVHTIFSRQYQTKAGLALKGWLILIGPTSCGKEIATKGPQEILRATEVPSVVRLLRGEPRSEQGLFRMLVETPRMLINVDECAGWIHAMCDLKASAYTAALREALTKVYSKGDGNGIFFATEKAEKGESHFIERPCVSIFGDSQDHNLYRKLTQEQILTGFIPRFLFIDVDRKGISLESQDIQPIPAALIERVKDALIFTGVAEARNDAPIRVPIAPEVEKEIKKYELYIRKLLFSEDGEKKVDNVFNNLQSRSGAKVWVYASLLAVCENFANPSVKMEHFQWARRFVDYCTFNTIRNLSEGAYSGSVSQQRHAVETNLYKAVDLTEDDRRKNKFFCHSEALITTPHVVPLAWLKNNVRRLRCFEDDTRRDVHTNVVTVLKELEEDGLFTMIDKDQSFKLFGSRCPVICQLTEEYWQSRAEVD